MACVVRRRFRWIRNPVPETNPSVEIRAIAGPLPEKMEALVLSDLPPPLQKHHDSPKTLIAALNPATVDPSEAGMLGKHFGCDKE